MTKNSMLYSVITWEIFFPSTRSSSYSLPKKREIFVFLLKAKERDIINYNNNTNISFVYSLSRLDGLRERIYPVGSPEVSASCPPVHLEHEDQHLYG